MYLIFAHFFFKSEQRSFELHSPDCVHNCILRASDPSECSAWYNSIHAVLAGLTQTALRHANSLLTSLTGEIHHIGWLSRLPHLQVKCIVYHHFLYNICFFIMIKCTILQISNHLGISLNLSVVAFLVYVYCLTILMNIEHSSNIRGRLISLD